MTITTLLLSALMLVESNNNPKAVSPNGKEVGVLQISKAVVTDVNRTYGTHYRLKDRYDVGMSKSICSLYLRKYCTRTRIKRPITDEDLARVWNGGPKGWQKESTLFYWERVHAAMQKLSGAIPLPEQQKEYK